MAITNRIGSAPKKNKKRWLFLGLGLAATSALSYFGFEYWQKHKRQRADSTASPEPLFVPPKKNPSKSKASKTKKAAPKTKPKTITINAPETAKKIYTAVTKKDF